MSVGELMTVREVAEALGVDPKTVYHWCWDGHLPHKRLGKSGRMIRISADDLQKYLARCQHEPAQA